VRFLTAAVVLLALIGCGGSGSAQSTDYAQGLVSAFSGVEQPSSLDSASLAALADDYGRAADELSRLTPPAGIAEPHARMVASMRAYSGGLERASRVTGDPVAFASEMSRAQSDAEAWTGAFEEIRAHGYATVSLPS
jgi:hypothetical protein